MQDLGCQPVEFTKGPETPILPYTQQHFLDLFDRILPESYLQPLKTPGPGYEYLQGVAAAAARVSESVAHEAAGQYIWTAQDGAKATGTVKFKRPTVVYGALTIKAGTVVSTPDGYRFLTTADAVLDYTDYEVRDVPVIAAAEGYLWNVPAPFVSRGGQNVQQGISQIIRPLYEDLSSNPAFDPTITVEQQTNMLGGVDPQIDALGTDRGLPQYAGEPVDAYRNRLSLLPDVVSPCAIIRNVNAYLQQALAPYGQQGNYSIIETWEPVYQTAYDFPINESIKDGPYFPGQTFTSNVFVYDDPRPAWMNLSSNYSLPYQVANRYMDERDVTAAIVVAVPLLPDAGDPDYTIMESVYTSLGQLLEQIKPAGITIEMILQGQ